MLSVTVLTGFQCTVVARFQFRMAPLRRSGCLAWRLHEAERVNWQIVFVELMIFAIAAPSHRLQNAFIAWCNSAKKYSWPCNHDTGDMAIETNPRRTVASCHLRDARCASFPGAE